MEITINTEHKTVKVQSHTELGEIVKFLKNHFGDWKEWKIVAEYPQVNIPSIWPADVLTPWPNPSPVIYCSGDQPYTMTFN